MLAVARRIMPTILYDIMNRALGLELPPHELTLGQMVIRTVILFGCAQAMLRFAPKRFFASRNAVDVLLLLILASTLSRAINGSAPFFATIMVGFVLVVLHRGLTALACRSHRFGQLLKGHPVTLVADGVVDEHALRAHHLSHHDLMEDLRLNGALEDPGLVKKAVLERSGEISIQRRPHVAAFPVDQGTQTVRVEIEG